MTTFIAEQDDGWLDDDWFPLEPFEVDGITYNPRDAFYAEAHDRPPMVDLVSDECFCPELDGLSYWTCSGSAFRWMPDMTLLRFGAKPDGGGDRA